MKSTSVRLSLAYAGIVFAAFLFAGALIWYGVRESAEQEVRQYIELEVHAIETELRTEGVEAAIAAIEARAERPGALEYWVTNANGERIIGDLPQMEGPNGWRRIVLSDGAQGADGRDEMLVLTESLPNGVRLSVGEDLRRVGAFREAALKTLAMVGVIAVLLCLIAGLIVTRRALTRMEALNATMRKVAAGDLSARFPSVDERKTNDIEEIGVGVNAMLDRIEELIDGLRRVTRDVAHDLRTPLSHLQQRLERAKEAETPEACLATVESAQEKTTEILKSFDAILRLAEIEAGSAKRRFEIVDLATLAEKAADAYRPDIEDSGRMLRISGLEAAEVFGDRDLILQALANLIENAMRHTPKGAAITLQTIARNDGAVLEVADNGPGIPAGERENMLKPFARLDASRSTPGSGLGLSMVAAIARLHGAELILSDNNPGLRISLSFPPAADSS